MEKYICKIANLDELIKKCDYEISRHEKKDIWTHFKKMAIKGCNNGSKIMYIGILDDTIICEASAVISKLGLGGEVEDPTGIFDNTTAYLCAFRTNPGFDGKGYFSRLYHFMEADLKSKGFTRLTLGVEPTEIRNKQIYSHLGFKTHIKTTTEQAFNPNPSAPPKFETIEYYAKEI